MKAQEELKDIENLPDSDPRKQELLKEKR